MQTTVEFIPSTPISNNDVPPIGAPVGAPTTPPTSGHEEAHHDDGGRGDPVKESKGINGVGQGMDKDPLRPQH